MTDEELISLYETARGNPELQSSLQNKLGYKNWSSVRDKVSSAKRVLAAKLQGENVVYEPYPDFQIKPHTIGIGHNRDPEDMGIVITDRHTGKKTETYNLDIQKARTEKMIESAITIINLHRPIRKVWIFDLGDEAQGENIHQGSKVGDLDISVYEQINGYAIPMLSHICCALASEVEEVEFVGVWGNHGIYDRTAPTKTNWDSFVYTGLKMALANNKNIKVRCPDKFYQLINILGTRFFLIHGNQVNATAGIPMFALRRKMQEWYAYVGGFNHGYCGHFHSEARDMVNSFADYTICPPLVTGDSWALEKIGRASVPQQLCFGVHEKYGRTWEYHLHTDDNYHSRKYDG